MSGDEKTTNQLQSLIDAYNGNVEEAIAALRDYDSVKKLRQKIPVNNNPVVVKIHQVTKRYKVDSQHIEALKGVSLDIKQGELIAITGPSGSGKSTLLQLIGGLDKPNTGEIMVDDQQLGHLRDKRLSAFRNKTIGFVFQFFYLQPFLNLRTNLEVPAMFAHNMSQAERRKRAEELAAAVGLSDRVNHLPKELSGGQMQRAAIARSLFNKPKIILADEPTGNLDSQNSQAIIELFDQVRRQFGTTIIIVTHDHSIATMADRELAMKDGELI